MNTNETSGFANQSSSLLDAEPLETSGGTCDAFRVKLYGKLHFLKRLKPELRTNPRYIAALQKEFETGYTLEHPHIVRYISLMDDGILMEYVDGMSLSDFIKENPDYFTDERQVKRFLTQLLDAVGYLHAHQIIHSDLKPQNILITRIGHEVKVIDLGFCYTDAFTDTTGHTNLYAAPEQKEQGATIDARADIYAIGRILEQLPLSAKYKHLAARCTKEMPDDRFQSIEDLQAALNSNSKKRMIAILLVAVVVALVAMLAFLPLIKKSASPTAKEQAKMVLTELSPLTDLDEYSVVVASSMSRVTANRFVQNLNRQTRFSGKIVAFNEGNATNYRVIAYTTDSISDADSVCNELSSSFHRAWIYVKSNKKEVSKKQGKTN